MGVEVSQHVRYGVEPEVVDVALPILINRQTQVLVERGSRERRGEKRHSEHQKQSDKPDQDRGQDII